MSGGNEGTEPPTQHKLQEARKKGDTPQSTELSHATATLLWSLVLIGTGAVGVAFLCRFIEVLLTLAAGQKDAMMMGWMGLHLALGVAPVCLVGLCAALGPELMQSRGRFATKREWIDLQRVNPIKRLKSMFELPRLLQLPLAFLRFVVVAAVAWNLFGSMLQSIQRVGVSPWYGAYQLAWWGAVRVLSVGSAICLGLGLVDALIQKKLWIKRNRMKKTEIQKEHKEQEGDPTVKSQRRQAHQESVS